MNYKDYDEKIESFLEFIDCFIINSIFSETFIEYALTKEMRESLRKDVLVPEMAKFIKNVGVEYITSMFFKAPIDKESKNTESANMGYMELLNSIYEKFPEIKPKNKDIKRENEENEEKES